jgi:hypothetical protein
MVSTPPFARDSRPISAGCAVWVRELPAARSYAHREYYQRALDSMKRTAQEFVEPQHYNCAGYMVVP